MQREIKLLGAVLNRAFIVAGITLIGSMPVAHSWLHGFDLGTEVNALPFQPLEKTELGQKTANASPERAVPIEGGHAGIIFTDKETTERFSERDSSPTALGTFENEPLEIGSPLDANDPAGWPRWEYGNEINFGAPMSADAPVRATLRAPQEPVDVENRRSEVYGDVIAIGPDIDYDAAR